MVVCLLAVLFGRTEGYFRRVCEHQAMSINCGSKLINIRSASYGRTQQGLCGSNGNTNCHAGSSMTVARHECQGQKRCTLYVKNSAFGDPCPGTVKYLTIKRSPLDATYTVQKVVRFFESQLGCYFL
ncbi:hypothetical protein ACROYT_G043009 [Oculina patagonica]